MIPMDFSIVVPFFNAGRFIERCARGLVSQTYPADRYEIFMIDNNSTDQSVAIVKGFDGIKLLHEPRQGSYAARNLGIQEARGEIVAFTDPDCVPQADWLEQIGRAMTEPQAGLVLGDRQFATDSGVIGMLAAYESELGARIFGEERVDCYYAYTNNMAVRMSILKTLGGFQTLREATDKRYLDSRGIFRHAADVVLMRRAMEQYGPSIVRYSPRVVVRHLEIASVRDYLEKKNIYGQISRNPELATPRALPLGARLSVAREARRRVGGSLADTVGFLGVLAAGAVRYEWERRRGSGR